MPRNFHVHGKVTNVIGTIRSLEQTREDLDDILRDGLSDLANTSVELLQAAAPKGRTKQLTRGIKARRRGLNRIDVSIHAIAPESGFDYAAVTRFGHRVAEITPTEGRKALRVRFQSSEVGFFDRVRGFQPSGDWVDHAIPAVEVKTEEVMKELGRELELRLLS